MNATCVANRACLGPFGVAFANQAIMLVARLERCAASDV